MFLGVGRLLLLTPSHRSKATVDTSRLHRRGHHGGSLLPHRLSYNPLLPVLGAVGVLDQLVEAIPSLVVEPKGDRVAELWRARQVSASQHILEVIDDIGRELTLFTEVYLDPRCGEDATEFLEASNVEEGDLEAVSILVEKHSVGRQQDIAVLDLHVPAERSRIRWG